MDGLITDRTPNDVESVRALTEAIKAGTATEEQLSEYLNVLQKGAYTYRDLNRVEDAVRYVAGRLREFGYLSSLPSDFGVSRTSRTRMISHGISVTSLCSAM